MSSFLGSSMRKIRKAGIEYFGFSIEKIKKSRALSEGLTDLNVEGIVLKKFIDNVDRRSFGKGA